MPAGHGPRCDGAVEPWPRNVVIYRFPKPAVPTFAAMHSVCGRAPAPPIGAHRSERGGGGAGANIVHSSKMGHVRLGEPANYYVVGVTFNTGLGRPSGLVQCWGKISFCFTDRFTAVAATVIVTAAVTVLVTGMVAFFFQQVG